MKHVIAGLAGHIDHGKTALVKALTGIDAETRSSGVTAGIFLASSVARRQPAMAAVCCQRASTCVFALIALTDYGGPAQVVSDAGE